MVLVYTKLAYGDAPAATTRENYLSFKSLKTKTCLKVNMTS